MSRAYNFSTFTDGGFFIVYQLYTIIFKILPNEKDFNVRMLVGYRWG